MADPRTPRLFRALLRLFPAEFRGDFGNAMAADFDDQRRDAASRPRETRRLWLRTCADLLWRAPREHLDILRRDASHAVRTLRRHPVSTATAVLSLTLGIGLNTAVFSVVYGVLWRELPFRDGDRLVVIGIVSPDDPDPTWVTPATYVDLARDATRLDGMAAAESLMLTLVEPGDPERVSCRAVTPAFFELLGTVPVIGRTFTPAEYDQARADRAGARERPSPRVMMLGHRLWQRRFGGATGIVGRQVTLAGGDAVEIVGVTSRDVDSLHQLTRADCWTPQEPDPAVPFRGVALALGRLTPGTTVRELGAELDVHTATLPPGPPGSPRRLHATSLSDRLLAGVRPQLLLLIGAVACVLLVTCANIASLLLARAAGRHEELATRVALGASRARLVRETLTESLVVSLAGGLGGFLLAIWAIPALVGAAPEGIPRLETVGVDWSTFGLTVAASAGVGLVCGVLASMGPHRRLTPALSSAARVLPRVGRVRQALAVAEIAVALVLVVGATLMVRSMRALGAIELGFDPAGVVSLTLPSPPGRFDLVRSRLLHAEIADRVKALPGVQAAGVGIGPLLGGMGIGGVTTPGSSRELSMRVDAVSPGYFEALGVHLLAGRFFSRQDTAAGSPQVILVNERAASSFWPGEPAVGRILIINERDELRVIGVVADLREAGLEADHEPTMYQLSTQSRNFLAGGMLIRASGDLEALVPAINSILRAVNPEEPLPRVAPLQERIDRETAPRRFVLQTIGLFSMLGLVLAVIGIYGVVAELTAQRVPEIGVRVTFGAQARDVVGLVLRQGWRLARVGVPLGVAGAVVLRHTMSSMVYGIGTLDPVTYVTAVVSLLGATALACAIPAARAARMDPIEALRRS